jgi:flagellar basal body-associated protein FliL
MKHAMSAHGGKIKLLVLLLLSMAIGGGATYGFLGRQKHPTAHKPKATEEKKQGEADSGAEPLYVDMGPFLVNITAQDRLRYLRAEVTLGIQPPEGEKKKKEGEKKDDGPKLPPGDDAKARDIIVQVLSRQSFDRLRLQGPDGELRKMVLDQLTQQLKATKVVSVLFTSFVMQ